MSNHLRSRKTFFFFVSDGGKGPCFWCFLPPFQRSDSTPSNYLGFYGSGVQREISISVFALFFTSMIIVEEILLFEPPILRVQDRSQKQKSIAWPIKWYDSVYHWRLISAHLTSTSYVYPGCACPDIPLTTHYLYLSFVGKEVCSQDNKQSVLIACGSENRQYFYSFDDP